MDKQESNNMNQDCAVAPREFSFDVALRYLKDGEKVRQLHWPAESYVHLRKGTLDKSGYKKKFDHSIDVDVKVKKAYNIPGKYFDESHFGANYDGLPIFCYCEGRSVRTYIFNEQALLSEEWVLC